jgi:hydroxymethylbilane synthase
MRKVILGTRGSALALWQARHVAARLRERHPDLVIEERIIRTEGDIQQHAPLGMGDRGVFVRRIEEALLAGEIDLAVHSLKDLPTVQPESLLIAAVPRRHDPRDALLTEGAQEFDSLPAGTVLATGSFRRRAQLLHARPDLKTIPVRGNVDTRVRKLLDGEFGALVLALAGIERLAMNKVPARPIDPGLCLPAVGQGALALETREEDEQLKAWVAVLDHPASHRAVVAERSFLRELGGGCLAPATAYARTDGGRLRIDAVVGDADGVELMRDGSEGPASDGEEMGRALAARMLEGGAGELLAKARESVEGDGRP